MIGSAGWVLNAARLAAGAYLLHAPTAARREPADHWVSVAWERIDRLARRGKLPTRDPHATRFAVRAGRLGCVDRLRVDTGSKRLKGLGDRAFRFEQFADPDGGDAPGRLASEVTDHRVGESAGERLLSLWHDTRRERDALRIPPIQRLRLYLWLVEGWTQLEIADAFGCDPSAVCASIARAVPPGCRDLMVAVSNSRHAGPKRANP